MIFSLKQCLARIKAFISSPNQQCTQRTVHLSSNFNSCSERLCEEMGQTLRKDESCAIFSHLQLQGIIYL